LYCCFFYKQTKKVRKVKLFLIRNKHYFSKLLLSLTISYPKLIILVATFFKENIDKQAKINSNHYLAKMLYLICWSIKHIFMENVNYIYTTRLHEHYVKDYENDINLFSEAAFSKQLPKAFSVISLAPGKDYHNGK